MSAVRPVRMLPGILGRRVERFLLALERKGWVVVRGVRVKGRHVPWWWKWVEEILNSPGAGRPCRGGWGRGCDLWEVGSQLRLRGLEGDRRW